MTHLAPRAIYYSAVAEARGLPILRLEASLLTPETTVADYTRVIGDLIVGDARVSRA